MGVLLYQRTMPALPECVSLVRRELSGQLGAARVSRVTDIELVVSEAWTNAVLHAYVHRFPGPVEARAVIDGRHLSVTVTDRGRGFAARVDSPGAGFGLMLMRRLATDVRISSGLDGVGTDVLCRFDDAAAGVTLRPPQAIDRADEIRDYLAALKRTTIELHEDAQALAAEAARAIGHAEERRRRFAAQRDARQTERPTDA